MRELTYYVAVSLDGRISGPADDFSAFPVEGDHIEMIKRDYRDTLPEVGLRMLGLTADGSRFDTDADGLEHLRRRLRPDPRPLSRTPASTSSPAPAAQATSPTASPSPARTRSRWSGRLKKEEGTGIWLCGGGLLASALVDEIDRLVLKVNPVVLQEGVPPVRRALRPAHVPAGAQHAGRRQAWWSTSTFTPGGLQMFCVAVRAAEVAAADGVGVEVGTVTFSTLLFFVPTDDLDALDVGLAHLRARERGGGMVLAESSRPAA